jgi:hypothetical protein
MEPRIRCDSKIHRILERDRSSLPLFSRLYPTSAVPKMAIFGCEKACCAARHISNPLRNNLLRLAGSFAATSKIPKIPGAKNCNPSTANYQNAFARFLKKTAE